MEPILIPTKKRRVFLTILISFAFTAFGLWAYLNPDFNTEYDPFIYQIGTLGIAVFFLGFALFYLKKLFSSKPALEFNDKGITDRCSSLELGFIPWKNITGMQVKRVDGSMNRMIVLQVNNAKELVKKKKKPARLFLEGQSHLLEKGKMEVRIVAAHLKISFKELQKLFEAQLKAHGISIEKT